MDNEDTAEKENIGHLWAEKSGNLFLVAWKQKNGMDIHDQLKHIME